jgi:AraC family transcriptional regulator
MVIRLAHGNFFGRSEFERSTTHLHLVWTSYGRGARLPLHAHERPYLAVVLGGGFAERSGRVDHSCAEGTQVLNAVGAEHADTFEAERTDVLNVEFDAEWLAALREERGRATDLAWVDGRAQLARVRHLRVQLARSEVLWAFIVEGLCAELLAYSARSRPPRRAGAPAAWLALVERALSEGFRRPPGLLELARLVGVGPGHLARAFRSRHGRSIGTHVRCLRAEHARRAVLQTRSPLAEIALEAGFADQSHMTREFRRLFGATPGALRR